MSEQRRRRRTRHQGKTSERPGNLALREQKAPGCRGGPAALVADGLRLSAESRPDRSGGRSLRRGLTHPVSLLKGSSS